MEFAINYSPAAVEKWQAGLLEVDRFKCPDWPDLIAEAARHRPVFVHFDLHLGPGLDPERVRIAEALREETGTPWLNVHLAPPRERVRDGGLTRARELVDRDLEVLRSVVPDAPVSVENVPFNALGTTGISPEAAAPDLMNGVLESWDLGLLLDLSHARLAAQARGQDEREYLSRLALERVVELHVTGIGVDAQGEQREHLELSAEDRSFFDHWLEAMTGGANSTPWVVALEYGGVGPRFEWRSAPDVIERNGRWTRERLHAAGVLS